LTEWMEDAACKDKTALFYTERKDRLVPEPEELIAKAICNACSVKDACVLYVLENPHEQGIWGGLTEYDRKKLRRGKPRQNRPANLVHRRALEDRAVRAEISLRASVLY
jgi:WhiB family transcriptional regulator, redox-sensing transcriptional regulator